MKKKVYLFLFVVFFLLTKAVNAQFGFLSSSHTFEIDLSELKVYQNAQFSMGSSATCPPLVDYQLTVQESTINICVSYNLIGSYPAFGCSRIDTISENIPDGNYTLIVNSQVIYYDAQNAVVDTVKVDSDTSFNVLLDIENLLLGGDIKIYPNPVSQNLFLVYPEFISSIGVEIFGLDGKQVKKKVNYTSKGINIQDLKSGVYFLKIVYDEKTILKKILIE